MMAIGAHLAAMTSSLEASGEACGGRLVPSLTPSRVAGPLRTGGSCQARAPSR
jgi:hypothetical protein